MDENAANQIIKLAMKWQNSFEWEHAHKQAEEFRTYRDAASKDWNVFQRQGTALLKGKKTDAPSSPFSSRSDEDQQFLSDHLKSNPEGMLVLFDHDAKYNEDLSEMSHEYVIDAHRELLALQNLVRQHAPVLLEYVPEVNFFDSLDANLSPKLRDLRKLEGEVRALISVEPRLAEHPTRKQKLEARDKQIKLLCKTNKLTGKWAELATRANDDPVIKQLALKPVTKHIVRNVIEPPQRRLKK